MWKFPHDCVLEYPAAHEALVECESMAEMLSLKNILFYYRETHWYQTVVYVDEPFSVPKGTPLTGSVALSPREENDRYD